MTKRFFQVGFNRCGTTAIAEVFSRHPYNTVHHTYMRDGEVRNIALDIAGNINSGSLPLAGMDQIDVFTDVEYVASDCIVEGYKFFRSIEEAYPEMRFILNVRRRDDWILSRSKFGTYPGRYADYLQVDRDEVITHWERDWDAHIADVQQCVPEEKLLLWDIDAPDYSAISAFVGFNVEAGFQRRNKSVNGPLAQFAQRTLPKRLLRTVPNEIKNYLKDF